MPDEQAALSRFVGFGARDLADIMFRRAGETFADGCWMKLRGQVQ